MSAKYKSPSFLLPNELNTSANTVNDTGINSLYSMDFDSSSSDYIDIGTISSLNAQQNFSISLWFKENVRRTNGFMFSSGTGVSNDIAINAANGTLKINVGGTRNVNTTSYSSNVWYHVVLTVENTTAKVYLNNGSPTTVTVGSNTSSSSGTLAKIGDLSFASGYYFDGKIDEVAIFNRALNTTEIAALYGGTSPNIYPSNLMATDLNPIAYYPLGEQAQNTGYLDPSNPGSDIAGSEWQFPNGVLQDYVMDFDGSTDYIDAGSSVGVIGTGVRTFSVWLKTSNTGVNTILGTRNVNTDGWVIQVEGTIYGTPNILFYNSKSTNARIQTLLNVADGNWHHIVIVRAGSGNNKIYVDGVSQTLSNGSENLTDPQSSKNLLIGAGYTTGEALFRFFDGELSNIAIWNSDQSANIANIYNNGSPQTTYTVNPQNWWKLNADSVYTPSVASYSAALDFGGTDYVDCGVVSAVENVSSFSMSVWVYPSNGNLKSVIGNWGNPYVGVEIGTSSGAVYFTVDSDTVGSSYGATPSGLSNNNWAHLVLVFDGSGSGNSGRLKGYINGVEQTLSYTGTIPATTAAPNRAFRIGDQHVGNGLIGNISNAAIFDSALTSTQVSTLFNFGTPETNISFSPISWWKLDNLTTGILDSGSASNNGTNNGATDISSGVAVTPSWKIPSALPIQTPNYTTALDFNNGNKVTLSSLNNFVTNNFTASIWVNYATLPASYRGNPMGATNGSGWETGFGFVNNGITGKLMFIVQNWDNNPTGSGGIVNSTTTFTTNQWFHLAGTWDGSTVTFYINGISQGTATYTGSLSTSDVLSIGTNLSSDSYDIDAILSNAAIFNTALPAAGTESVASLYNQGTPLDISSYSSLKGWWKLDSTTITDSSGNGNTGTNNGATQVTSDVLTPQPVNGVSTTLPSTALQQSDLQFDSPYSNYSLSFDGGGTSYIDIESSTELDNVPSNPYSFSFWFKSSTAGSVLSEKRVDPNLVNAQYTIHLESGYIQWYGGADGLTSGTQTSSTLVDDQWHHIVCVAESTTVNKIYVDGQLDVTSSANRINSSVVAGTFNIGANYTGSYRYEGKLDETSIFNYALSSAQILEIYNNGRPKDLTTFSGTAPISWWRLGENAYFDNNSFVVPNSISGAPNGTGSGTITTMISADAPGTYANGIGTNLDILDRVGDAPLSTSNSQSYNMIPSDISPYVPKYVGLQTDNIYSMSFNGTDEYFDAGNPTELKLTGAFSVSFWMKTIITGSRAFVSKDSNTSNPRGFSVEMSNSAPGGYFVVYNGTTAYGVYVYSSDANYVNIRDNNWHHITAVYTPSTSVALFIDGNFVKSNTTNIPASVNFVNNNLNIGRRPQSGGANYHQGELDEVAIFDKALTAGQIFNDLYQPTSTATNKTADLVNNPNLPTPVAWYRMGD